MCPLYYRMPDLYGDRDNVNPPATREAGRHDAMKKTLRDASSNVLFDEALHDTIENGNGNSNDSMHNSNISYNNGSGTGAATVSTTPGATHPKSLTLLTSMASSMSAVLITLLMANTAPTSLTAPALIILKAMLTSTCLAMSVTPLTTLPGHSHPQKHRLASRPAETMSQAHWMAHRAQSPELSTRWVPGRNGNAFTSTASTQDAKAMPQGKRKRTRWRPGRDFC